MRDPTTAAVGPYLLGAVLGRGRRSTVYLAGGAVPLALKVARDADVSAEFGVLAALQHPNIVRAHARGAGWLALELADGPLWPEGRGAADEARVRIWLAQAAAALAHVHAQGWVHRDVKPANLLRRADGSVVLADFGEAVPCGTVPPAGTVPGSPRHAAPEQGEGAPASPAADVYSLGVVLHEWLTGQPPFDGQTAAELRAQHLLAPVPTLAPALAHWQPLLAAMLAKAPAQRLPDGQAVHTRIASS